MNKRTLEVIGIIKTVKKEKKLKNKQKNKELMLIKNGKHKN